MGIAESCCNLVCLAVKTSDSVCRFKLRQVPLTTSWFFLPNITIHSTPPEIPEHLRYPYQILFFIAIIDNSTDTLTTATEMETINNAASAASKALFGDKTPTTQSTESGTEPVSGQTGNTEAGEPYDAGNLGDSTNTDTTKPDTRQKPLAGEEKASDAADSGIPSGGSVGGTGNTPNTGPIRPEHETDKTGVTSVHEPSSKFSDIKPTSSDAPPDSGPQPSVGADPASGQQNTQKQQGADRPHEEPGPEENEAIKATKQEAEEASKVDTSGPGPKPLADVNKGSHAASQGDNGPQKESHGEGTGEKYVKSSGLKADGGDFDAANPGAGKEADRLLETKGIHHTAPGEPSQDTNDEEASGGVPSNGKGPKIGGGLKNKIKAKLHKS